MINRIVIIFYGTLAVVLVPRCRETLRLEWQCPEASAERLRLTPMSHQRDLRASEQRPVAARPSISPNTLPVAIAFGTLIHERGIRSRVPDTHAAMNSSNQADSHVLPKLDGRCCNASATDL